MVSVYGYITVAQLESFAAEDYSGRSTSYTDGVIESVITQAERLINVYTNQSFTGTIPDAIVYVTTHVAFRIMHNRMLFDGAVDRDNFPKRFEEYLTDELIKLLEPFLLVEGKTRTIWWE